MCPGCVGLSATALPKKVVSDLAETGGEISKVSARLCEGSMGAKEIAVRLSSEPLDNLRESSSSKIFSGMTSSCASIIEIGKGLAGGECICSEEVIDR